MQEDYMNFIVAPAGFDIGAMGGEEIALSILAQIVERRRIDTNMHWAGSQATETKESEDVAEKEVLAGTSSKVVDPVCGMTVDLDQTPFRYELEGTMYGFCCPKCQSRFVKEPEAYLNRV